MPKKGRRSSKANASSNSSPNTNNEETKNKRKRIEEKENHEKDDGVPSKKVKKVTLKFSGQEQSFTPKNDEEEENLTHNKKDTVNNEQINNNIIANKKTVSIIDLLDIIHKLYKEDQQGIFYYPVNEAEVPGYSSIIVRPMDLSTLKARLCQLKYKTVGQFKNHMKLIFENAMVFNPPESIFYQEAQRLNELANDVLSQYKDDAKIVFPEELNEPEPNAMQSSLRKSFLYIIEEFQKIDAQAIFHLPVPVDIPNYYLMIEQPLDFQTLKKKIKSGCIKNWNDFKSNLLLIFTNATKYNEPATIFHKVAKQMIKKVDPMIKSVKETGKISEKEATTPAVPTETPKKKKSVPQVETPSKTATSKEAATPSVKEEDVAEKLKSPTKKKSSSTKKWSQRPPPANELELPKFDKETTKQLQLAFLNKLKEADIYSIFLNPVEVPGYTDTIENPMDFSTIQKKIESDEYGGEWKPFEDDVELVFSNAKKFNLSSSVYFKESNRLLRMFRKWKKGLYHITIEQKPLDNSKVLEYFEKVAYYKKREIDPAILDEIAGKAEEPIPEPVKEHVPPATSQPRHIPAKGGTRLMSDIIAELIDELIAQDKNKFFLTPPEKTSDSISEETPLDLIRMRGKKYKKLSVFEEDFKLLCDHAVSINDSRSEIAKEAQRLLKFGEKKIGEIRKRLVKPQDLEKGKPSDSLSKASRRARAENRDNRQLSDKVHKLNREQAKRYEECVKATNNLYRMQKRDLVQNKKDYCPLIEIATVPNELLNPVPCDPGDFPLYEFVSRTTVPMGFASMTFPPATPTTAPIMSQLFQGVTGATAAPAPSLFTIAQTLETPEMKKVQQSIAKCSIPQVLPFAYAQQPRVLSYKPVRIMQRIPMVVKSYTEFVPKISQDEFEFIQNANIDECLRSPKLFQSLMYRDYTTKKEQQKQKDQVDELSLQKLFDSRRKADVDVPLLELLKGTTASTDKTATESKKAASNKVTESEVAIEMSETERELIKDLTSLDHVPQEDLSESQLQEMYDDIVKIMAEQGIDNVLGKEELDNKL